ncbi:MAG: OsmC family protein [Capsulimonadales bacterium]|nr:OsmC family protein [Capsulimonadales bacterium]
MNRTANAVWNGSLKDGSGTISTQSGVLNDTQYSFKTRFADGIGTNPEELIGAAHAGCYAMALSLILANHGMTPETIRSNAVVTLEQKDGGFAITKIHLTVSAKVPGATSENFLAAATEAKENCPVSQVLKAEITMDATLEA